MKNHKHKIRYFKMMITAFTMTISLFFICSCLNTKANTFSQNIHNTGSQEWNLILVNYNHPIPKNYDIELTELSNGRRVDSRMYPYLQKMFDQMRSEGIYPIVGEGYRTADEQEQMMKDKIEAYINEGYSKKTAKKLAKTIVAAVGTSEHQLGLAVDINADKTLSTNDDVYTWLADHAYQYGFILRYPADKTKLTGIGYEPWHYRYVGKNAAKEIFTQGLCLEEYIETLL